jgi:hypothetical protein
MEKSLIFPLGNKFDEKIGNITYLGASECFSIWLKTYTCVSKMGNMMNPLLGKIPFSRKSWNLIIRFSFVVFKFSSWV